ncbi:F0F1 ATP synthase subunit A [Candidatus Saccharibacteria bacterium]|nr:F0F1 ATP synthase subunit A [Candidatus Saccharibacteria bacterium]
MSAIHFATESAPAVHITPTTLFHIGSFPITNSMIFAWLASIIIVSVLMRVARRMTLRPKGGFTQVVEAGTEFITDLLENSLGGHERAIKYGPYFVTIFFFIALSNLMGLLPGVGEALTYHGEPVFRAFTADLNATLAAAAVSLTLVQYFAIRESGFIRYLRHYFGGKLWNPLTYLVGAYEIFGEFIRLFSLSLRLFLNIAIGEIIIAVFAYLGKFAAPITAFPFLLLEMGVALLQAYIFVMLSVTYLSLAIHHQDDDEASLEQERGQIANLEAADT